MVIGPRQAMQAKRAGLKPGVPDLVFPIPRGVYHGLFVELKRRDEHAKASDAQLSWLEYLRTAGYHAIVCRGADEAERAILNYLEGSVNTHGLSGRVP